MDHCLAGIDRLSHEVKDASGYIPAYDQRTYGEVSSRNATSWNSDLILQAIKALSEKLQTTRNSFNPPRKFQFKTRKNASAISLSDAAELAQTQKLRGPTLTSDTSNTNSSFAPTPLDRLSPKEEKPDPNGPTDGIDDTGGGVRKPSFSQATHISLTNHKNIHIILPTSASHATSSGTVSNLRNCVVDLALPTTHGAPFAALYLKNIARSLLVCGHVAGAAHITGLQDSVVVVACRQFRMHSAKNVDVYLHSASRPIIEDCENVRFAPLPDAYVSPLSLSLACDATVQVVLTRTSKTTPAIAETANQWDQIDDFKWLQAEHSPHFSVLPAAERIEDRVWREKVPGGHGDALNQILKAVGVPL